MPTSTIELPVNFVSGLTAQASAQLGAFAPYLTFVLGFLLVAAVIGLLISFFK